jgi:hypothetical protein
MRSARRGAIRVNGITCLIGPTAICSRVSSHAIAGDLRTQRAGERMKRGFGRGVHGDRRSAPGLSLRGA